MIKARIYIILFLLPLSATSQNLIDSLAAQLSGQQEEAVQLNLLSQLSEAYQFKDADSSIWYAREAIDRATGIGNQKGRAKAEELLSKGYMIQSDYPKALAASLRALKIYEDLDDLNGRVTALTGIGRNYLYREDYRKAISYLGRVVEIQKDRGDEKPLSHAYANLGTAYKSLDRFDSALFYYKQAESVGSLETDINLKLGILHNKGVIHYLNGNYAIARANLKEVVKITRELGDKPWEAAALALLASILNKEDEIDKALSVALEGKNISDSLNITYQFGDSFELLSEIYEQKEDYSLALQYFKKFKEISDSTLNEARSRQIAEVQEKYNSERQFREIIELKSKQQAERYLLYSVIAASLSVALIIFLIFSRQRIKSKKDKLQIDIKLKDTQLQKTELKNELEFQNQELTAYKLNIIQKNDLIENVKDQLNGMASDENITQNQHFKSLQKLVKQQANKEKQWEDFKFHFEKVHQDFFTNIKEQFPHITPNDLKLCALIRLNLNIKESASMLGISPESLKTARHRLRKKFDLPAKENLADFMMGF